MRQFRPLRLLAVATVAAALPVVPPATAQPTGEAEPALAIAHGDPALVWGACPDFMPEGCAIAVLHGDPAQPNADVFFRIPGGARIPKHWHTSAERMVLVAGEMHVGYEGQAPAVLRVGSYAYGPPRHVHEARCASADPCVLFIAFEQPVDAIAVDDRAPAD